MLAAVLLAVCVWQPLEAFLLQQRAASTLGPYLDSLGGDSDGFACLLNPLVDPLQQEAVKEAVQELLLAQQTFLHQAYPYYLLGRAYCLLGDYPKAKQALLRFVELRPANPLANLELGFVLEKLCPPDGSCADLTTVQAWQRAGIVPDHLIANAKAAQRAENYEEAIHWYRRAQTMGRDLRSAMAFVEYQCALKEGNEDDAYAALQKAVALDTGWADAEMRFLGWYRYGRWQVYVLGNRKEAEKAFSSALASLPDLNGHRWEVSESFRLIGDVQLRELRFNEALHNFESALSINPNNQWVYYDLGQYFFETTGDLNLVEQQFIRATELSPNDVQLWKSIVGYLLQKSKSQLALKFCEMAMQKSINLDQCLSTP